MSIEVDSKLQGKVTGITNFGAFVELPNGSTGLVHISEVADSYVKDINEHFKVGDMVEVKVMNVGADGKIGLSIRRAKPESERPRNVHNALVQAAAVVQVVEAVVRRTSKQSPSRKFRAENGTFHERQ